MAPEGGKSANVAAYNSSSSMRMYANPPLFGFLSSPPFSDVLVHSDTASHPISQPLSFIVE